MFAISVFIQKSYGMVINLVYFEVKSWFMTAVNQYVIITSVSEWIYLISFKLSEILGFTNMALDHAQSYAARV